MSKYEPLYKYLIKQTAKRVTLKMEEIEAIVDFKLPNSAYKYSAWWSNSKAKGHPWCRTWTDAGYFTVDVQKTIFRQEIIFEKE